MCDHQPAADPADPPPAGSAAPDAPDALRDPGWACSMSFVRAHYVTADAAHDVRYRRPVGVGLCGAPGFIDEKGLAEGASKPHCYGCTRRLQPRPPWGVP